MSAARHQAGRRSRAQVAGAALAASVVVLLAAVTTWRATRPRRDLAHAGASAPGIVLLVVDTLRADALEPDAISDGLAHLRTWARDATSFRGTLATSSWTAPSVASILTGRLPTGHGVVEVRPQTRLAGSVRTLASLLHDAGYTTAASTGGGWVSPGTGLASGFQRFETDFDRRRPADVVDGLRATIEPGRPFFFFLHTYAAHDPYGDHFAASQRRCDPAIATDVRTLASALRNDPPSPARRHAFLRAMLTNPCGRLAMVQEVGVAKATHHWLTECRPFLDGGWRDEPGGAEAVADLHRAYRTALAHVDARLAETLEAVDRLPAGTIVVIVGDHGEAFGEHGPVHHGRYVHPEMVRVPLLVRADGLPRGATVDAPCSVADVTPTLLDLAGVPAPSGLDGVSLRRVATGDAPRRAVVSVVAPGETPEDTLDAHLRRVAVRDATWTWTGVLDTRTATWGEDRWYDRVADPDEHRPLATAPDPVAASVVCATRDEVRRVLESRARRGVSGS